MKISVWRMGIDKKSFLKQGLAETIEENAAIQNQCYNTSVASLLSDACHIGCSHVRWASRRRNSENSRQIALQRANWCFRSSSTVVPSLYNTHVRHVTENNSSFPRTRTNWLNKYWLLKRKRVCLLTEACNPSHKNKVIFKRAVYRTNYVRWVVMAVAC